MAGGLLVRAVFKHLLGSSHHVGLGAHIENSPTLPYKAATAEGPIDVSMKEERMAKATP